MTLGNVAEKPAYPASQGHQISEKSLSTKTKCQSREDASLWTSPTMYVFCPLLLSLAQVGDLTKQAHYASASQGPVKRGVFAHSRHPNYYGEMLVWASYWTALGLSSGTFLICALCLWLKVITMLGSTKRLEAAQRKKYGFDPYFEKTPVLMPCVPLYTLLGKEKTKEA
eukprot:g27550.t1